MRIDPSGTHTPLSPTTANAAAKPATKPTGTTGSSPEIETYVPTGDLTRLIQLAGQVPDVRSDVVAEVASRLAAGELNTSAAATGAALAIIEGMQKGE